MEVETMPESDLIVDTPLFNHRLSRAAMQFVAANLVPGPVTITFPTNGIGRYALRHAKRHFTGKGFRVVGIEEDGEYRLTVTRKIKTEGKR